jgi:RHS repeat-associated protein
VYDGNGNRVTKTEATSQGNKVTRFLVDENQQYAQVLEERESQNGQPAQVSVAYLYGDDLLNQVRGGQRSYYHYDALGSTRALSDQTGSLSDRYQYEAFGNSTVSSGNTTNLYRFTGEQFDPSLRMYYLRARWYDSTAGRFLSHDPFAGTKRVPLTLHKYLYASADPANRRDPTGAFTIPDTMAGISLGFQISTSVGTRVLVRYVAKRLTRVLLLTAAASIPSSKSLLSTDECFRNGGIDCDSDQNPPIIVWGNDYGEHTKHIFDAISEGRRRLLHYQDPNGRNWLKKVEPCKSNYGTSSGLDCDEYPFALSSEGGPDNAANVSLRLIDARVNSGAGGKLIRFLERCNVQPVGLSGADKSEFLVVAEPGLPRTLTYCKGARPIH